jgi:hypothetical protein
MTFMAFCGGIFLTKILLFNIIVHNIRPYSGRSLPAPTQEGGKYAEGRAESGAKSKSSHDMITTGCRPSRREPEIREVMMKNHKLALLLFFVVLAVGFTAGRLGAAEPSGAKALFFSGEGTTIARSGSPAAPQPTEARVVTPSKVKYMGVSYWVDRLSKNGEMKRVSSSTVFRKGDRIRVSLKSNRDGYLYVVNQGSTGASTLLFPNASVPQGNNYINANQTYEIPPNSFFRFDANPGQETLIVMLSPTPIETGAPAPFSPPGQMNASAPPPPPPQTEPLPVPEPQGMASAPPPPLPEPQMMASAQDMGAKGMSRGSKDLMVEGLTTRATTRAVGQKDLYVEEDRGPSPAFYAVAPVSSLEQGGRIISLKITLKHR